MSNNHTFEGLMNNPELIKLGQAAAKPFKRYLNPEEIYNCILIAMWKSLKGYKEGSGKYTTYLFTGVELECTIQRNLNKPNKRLKRGSYSWGDFSMVDALDEINDDENKDILIDYYIKGYTYGEIGHKLGLTRHVIRKKVIKSKENISERLLTCV